MQTAEKTICRGNTGENEVRLHCTMCSASRSQAFLILVQCGSLLASLIYLPPAFVSTKLNNYSLSSKELYVLWVAAVFIQKNAQFTKSEQSSCFCNSAKSVFLFMNTECQLEKLRFRWEKWLATWTKSSFTVKSENLGDWRPPFRGRSDPLGSQLTGREGWSKQRKGDDNGTEGDTVVKLVRGTPWVGGECKLKKFVDTAIVGRRTANK